MAADGKQPRRGRRILGLDEQERQAERRRLLLAAALERFGTNGYQRTSIETLCQTAGIGTNSFYDLFPNKEAVLIALYDQITDQLLESVAAAYVEHRGDPRVVHALVGAFVHRAADDPRVAHVAFIEAAGVSPAMEAHRRTTRDRFVEGLEAIGGELITGSVGVAPDARADVPGPSPRRNAVALVGAIIETTVDWLAMDDPDPVDDLVEDIAHHCERVLRSIAADIAAVDVAARPSPPR